MNAQKRGFNTSTIFKVPFRSVHCRDKQISNYFSFGERIAIFQLAYERIIMVHTPDLRRVLPSHRFILKRMVFDILHRSTVEEACRALHRAQTGAINILTNIGAGVIKQNGQMDTHYHRICQAFALISIVC